MSESIDRAALSSSEALQVFALFGAPPLDLARQLQASLISFDGTQHTAVFKGNQCIDTAVVNYLVDMTPPGDLHC